MIQFFIFYFETTGTLGVRQYQGPCQIVLEPIVSFATDFRPTILHRQEDVWVSSPTLPDRVLATGLDGPDTP